MGCTIGKLHLASFQGMNPFASHDWQSRLLCEDCQTEIFCAEMQLAMLLLDKHLKIERGIVSLIAISMMHEFVDL